MVNSGYQPASTASACAPGTGGTISIPACSSGSVSDRCPSAITRLTPRRPNTLIALLAGVIIASSGSPNPISRSSPAYCLGVRVAPLVNTTKGTPRPATQLVISTAPGSARIPWPVRPPSTSVPSMSNTNPRTPPSLSRTRSSTTDPAPLPGLSLSLSLSLLHFPGPLPGLNLLRFPGPLRGHRFPRHPAPSQLEPEPRLLHHQASDRRPRPELPQQPEHRLDLRVVMPRRGPRGEHRVHLLGRHAKPQQQVLVR